MGDDRRQPPDRTAPMGRFDDDETRIRPGGAFDETRVRPGGGLDETRVRPAGAGGAPDGTPDGTRMLPPTPDEPPRWEARATVPPAGAVPPAPYEYYEEPVPPPDDRNWLRPLLFGLLGLVLLGALLTGIWLIFTADDEPPAPQASASAAPSAPATTRTTPPATSAPPTSAAPETVVVPGDLIGLTEDEARQKLEDAGLRVQVTRRADATMAPGTVIEADPEPGSDVEPNTVVRIVVATAPRPSPPRSSQEDGNG
jgi:hypothetical protein